MSFELRRFPEAPAAALACGQQILEWLGAAMTERGGATLAISGGSSPKPMFEMFAHARFPWDRVHVFWVDERCVPPTDPQSNYKFAHDLWLGPARVPERNIHRVHAELAPQQAGHTYSNEIFRCFGLANDELPCFDVIHRGMGPDAHTASLFPGEELIANRHGIVGTVYVEQFRQWRVTLLPGVLEAARHTAILATGADKAQALAAVLHAPYDPMRWPAQIASREGSNAVWFVDQAASPLAT